MTSKKKSEICRISFILINIFIFIFSINFISASDVLVWQGQYYTGTTFNTGTYEFNFSVYDNLTAGNICYSNITNLTTGNFGEWVTEQFGAGYNCRNSSKDYFLNINILGIDQTPRRRLTSWSFLRNDIDEITIPSLKANLQIIAPIINATHVVATELNITNNTNIFGVLRGHSPLKIGDAIQYVSSNDSNLFSIYTGGQNASGNNVSSLYYGAIIHQIETHTNPSGIEECWWDREDQEMRMCLDKTNLELWNNLLINKNANVTGNITAKSFIGDGSQLIGISSFNFTYNSLVSNVSRNWTLDTFNTWNSAWLSTYNSTYAGYVQGNASFNQSFANTLYAPNTTSGIQYLINGSNINFSSVSFNILINGTGNITTTGKIQGNYYSNDNSLGITNITGYSVCLTSNCVSKCVLQIKNGLITGCV
jgi:hypothetical protein